MINKKTNKALNIYLFNFEINGELKQSAVTGLNNQIFYLEKQDDGSFLIMASHSGLYLENVEDPKSGDSSIKQKNKKNLPFQNFFIDEIIPCFFTIKAKDAPLFLTIKNESDECVYMSPYDKNNIDSQSFSFNNATRNKILIPSGYYSITNKNSKKVLCIEDYNLGSPLRQDVWNGGDNQIFYFELKNDNSYTIRAAHSDMYLQASTIAGLTIDQHPPNSKDDQIFYLEEDTPGTFYLKSKVLGRVFGILNASMDNGVKVIQYLKKDDDNQKFELKYIVKNPNNAILLDTKRNQVVAEAKKYLGVPYFYGGTSPAGFDCSGFVQYVYKQMGISISRTTYTQINDGIKVSDNDLKPGDLIFFGTISDPYHVGMYVGSSQYIHAPQTGDVVKISGLGVYLTARRIIY